MATYDEELLAAAEHLLTRRPGQRGKLPNARIRRSISTAYYGIFHFLLLEAGVRLVGATNDIRRRRRTFARSFTHAGMRSALEKVRHATVDPRVADLLRPPGESKGIVESPAFARKVAAVFSDAQAKRHDADYDLNETLSEPDAKALIERVKSAVQEWRAARSPTDSDFKRALCILMLLRGQLRREG
jgi:hypothetical protein